MLGVRRSRAASSCSTRRYGPDEVWDELPREVQEQIVEKRLRFFVIDAYAVAQGGRHGHAHQHDHADVLLRDLRRAAARRGDRADQGRDREDLRASAATRSCSANFDAVDATLAHLHEVAVPAAPTATRRIPPPIAATTRPTSCKRVTAVMLANQGDLLPVSAFPVDGTWPTGTAQWEKRNIATEIPVWDAALCIQCNKCALVCPHAAIRVKVYDPARWPARRRRSRHVPYKGAGLHRRTTPCRWRPRTAPAARCA